ncbi:MAG: hypothetical protein JO316_04155 [Abitibacteriaceae bacterium]|nr:hypothetical protein [Abditibacteriaceae bacterium]
MDKVFSTLSLSAVLLAGAAVARAEAGFTYLDDQAEAGGYDVITTMEKLPVELSLAEQANGDGYRLKMTANGAQLATQAHGVSHVLATAQGHIDPGSLVAQRRGAHWRIITGKRVLIEADDDRWHEGKIGYRGSLKDNRVQPVEDIFFDDDFMRVAADVALNSAKDDPHQGMRIADVKIDETLWKPLAGKWSTTGLSENEQAQVAQSANPFVFKTSEAGTSLATTGRPFWDNYQMEASIKPEGATAVGLALYVQDDKNYLLFDWQAKGPMQLRAMVNGKPRILDQAAGGYEQKQWYRVRFSDADGVLRAYVDDAEVLRAHTGLFGRGPAGVYAENPTKEESAVFDDVSIRSVKDVRDDFDLNVPGRWQTTAGSWRMANAAQPVDERAASAVLGEGGWKDYITSASITLPADAAAGLILDQSADKGAYLLRVAGSKAKLPYAGKAQIVKVASGQTTVLGETAIGNRFDGKKVNWDFSAQRGYLKGTANDTRIVDAFDESLATGRAGMFAQRGAKGIPQLTAFTVDFPRPHATWAKVPELYELERQAETMGGWSTPEGFWINAAPVSTIATSDSATATNKTLWHKGTFWGDGSVRFKLPALTADQQLKLMFDNVQSAAAARNRSITLTLRASGGTLKGNLLRGTATQGKSGELKLEGPVAGQPVEVQQRGTFIIVRVGNPDKARTLLVARMA